MSAPFPKWYQALGVLMALMGWLPCGMAQVAGLPKLAETKAAAEHGDATAQTRLADEYALRQIHKTAAQWYRSAALQGDAKAQYKLGMMLKEGRSEIHGTTITKVIEKDEQQAFRWFLLAAKQDHAEAQYETANCYQKGKVVQQDIPEAYKWMSLSARQKYLFGITGRGDLILKMTSGQIDEGERRVAAFATTQAHPPAETREIPPLALKGIALGKTRRLAIINDRTFEPGETRQVKAGKQSVKVRCVEIREKTVLIEVVEDGVLKELRL